MSKRIAVVTPQVPFFRGGNELHAEALTAKLKEYGYESCLVTVPYKWYPNEVLIENCVGWRMLDLTETNGLPIDAVICIKFPSYVVKHPRKIVWLNHQYRQAYDLFGTEHGLPATPENYALRERIREIDRTCLGEARKLFACSKNVQDRLRRFNQIESEVLYVPLTDDGLVASDEYGDFVLSVGRLDPLKRLELLIEALSRTRTPVRAVIAGEGPDKDRLLALAERFGVRDRITFAGRVSDHQLRELYSTCLGVYYAPVDEDYGLVALEALKCKRPVLTGEDSGGVLEIIGQGRGGLIMPPQPALFAEGIDRLYSDRQLCRRLGADGHDFVAHINWETTVARLTEFV